MQFYFYVLNGNFNTKKPEMYNIFNCISVQEASEKTVKKYLKSPKNFKYEGWEEEPVYGFEGFKKELLSIIQWKERARVEYEIEVSNPFNEDKTYKWDCAMQAEANIETIAHEVIRQYKEQKKEK